MRKIHVVMSFSRQNLKETLIDAYRPMGIIWHPIVFEDEAKKAAFTEEWIRPAIIPGNAPAPDFVAVGTQKVNHFIRECAIINEDYYCIPADDDMYEPGVFDAIRDMDDPVIFISMKRGYNVPPNLPPEKRYEYNTLIAHPDNVQIGMISGEQFFVKGDIFKTLYFDTRQCADGEIAMQLKDKYPIRYEPDLYALFNFYEPGRWDKRGGGIAFGVMVNDPMRLNMVLQQSEIRGKMHFVQNPESATKGLNKLLSMIEATDADIAVLTHQDMYYRSTWLPQVKEQIAKLPESWIVAGIIGKDMKGVIAGQFHDMRIPADFNTRHIHEFPQPACCFDECCIIVNLKKGFRFDEGLKGFDLYGTLCVLQAAEMGVVAWILDAYAEHYCMRPFTWCPDDSFCNNYKWLFDRFAKVRVDSTALGLPEGQDTRELIFETSAA